MPEISERTSKIELSASISISSRAISMREKGIDVISLSAGEPDAPMPDTIRNDAIKALQNGHTKYTKVDGITPLKEAIINKLKAENKLTFEPEEIIVGSGAKQVIFNAIMAFVGEGDEVIVPSPYWVSYPEIVRFAGGKCVFVSGAGENDYKISPEDIAGKLTSRTRAIFLNSPSNPAGSVYSRDELTAIGETLRDKNILIISDEIYEKIIYPPSKHHSITALCPYLRDKTIVINGLSKAYSMPGMRIGYGAAPRYIIDAIKKIQSHSTSNANSIAQYASVNAFHGCETFIKRMLQSFLERRDFVYKRLSEIKGFRVRKPQGAFYFFPDISALLKKGFKDDIELCSYLLEKAHVAVVPGTSFGAPKNIRLSYAADKKLLSEALDRIEKTLHK